ncbi:MAG: glycerophosphodiester phosphodiesterase family protein [Edaphobacter sp.]|uniref:glycerophosphodiester phosphodiesterase family protein n=1 Tax=Edaphobacter sp. TaxID=1934404 RepID=UPI00239264A5|nr:glycerophosphodiester phosphodiesterase family protein [Edaphobacter sp.]MDE1176869.1 glycerophosphodiester phosphodiesterase family protein [Edaphobacter sp.]
MRKKIAGFLLAFSLPAALAAQAQTIAVHAHRGGRAARPENTLPAFRYAAGLKVDALELDIAVTKDNVLVVSHSPYLTQPHFDDPRISAALSGERHCDGPALPPGTTIHQLTLAQLRQYDCGAHTLTAFPKQVAVPHTTIPTFDEVLDLAPLGAFDFNVETKILPSHPENTPSPEVFAQMIDEAVRKHHLQSRVILQSFDFRTLHAMKAIDPEIRLSALFGEPKYDHFMGITDTDKGFLHMAESAGLRKGDFLSPDESLVTPAEVEAAHKAGYLLVPYTINDAAGWQKLADAHVDAIITDDPAGLLDWLRAQQPSLHR